MNIEELRRKLLVKYPFFGGVITGVKYEEKKEVETAATDGEIIYYNEEFMNSLTLEEQLFVFAHEVCHIALDHMKRGEDKNPTLWNIATDAVINQLLQKDGLKIVEGGINFADAINFDAESYYQKLLKQKKEKPDLFKNIMDNSNNGKGHASHDSWSDGKEKNKGSNKNKDSKNNSDNKRESRKEKKEAKEASKSINKTQEEASNMGEQKAFEKNNEEKKELLEKLKKDLKEKIEGSSKSITDSTPMQIPGIGKARQIIDWRYLLKEAVYQKVDWSYDNAYIENGVLIPNLEYQPLPETEIVLDTSGSVDEDLLKCFLRECKNIMETSVVKVGCFNDTFYGFSVVKDEEDIDKLNYHIGGGTDFDVAVNAFTDRVDNRIIFTDGEADMPKKAVDAIWVVFGSKRINPRGGKVIYVNENEILLQHYRLKREKK